METISSKGTSGPKACECQMSKRLRVFLLSPVCALRPPQLVRTSADITTAKWGPSFTFKNLCFGLWTYLQINYSCSQAPQPDWTACTLRGMSCWTLSSIDSLKHFTSVVIRLWRGWRALLPFLVFNRHVTALFFVVVAVYLFIFLFFKIFLEFMKQITNSKFSLATVNPVQS